MSWEDRFERYGSPRSDADVTIRGFFLRPNAIDRPEDIKRYDNSAQAMIAEAKRLIEDMESYRVALFMRYQELTAMQYRPQLRIRRYKQYKGNVTYFVEVMKIYEDGREQVEQQQTFPGNERWKALKAFEAAKKQRPGIEAVMDIEKGRWER